MKQQQKIVPFFSFRGVSSIMIGIVILIFSYGIQYTMEDGNLIDKMLVLKDKHQIQNFNILMVIIAFFLFPISIFSAEKIKSKKLGLHKIHQDIIKVLFKYTLTLCGLFIVLIIINKNSFFNYITPIFLVSYSCILAVFEQEKERDLFIIVGICLFLSLITIMIPSYWYYSFYILGVSHITYGINNK
ncbi:hypothetical protein [Polaribacter sp.]|uniref:hypothetical protein n=1 Tax=Polaribacter sp. TaxID=1920175 RepID=UPI0025E670E3|nr:hypothetical protein [Polaribacter sp.]